MRSEEGEGEGEHPSKNRRKKTIFFPQTIKNTNYTFYNPSDK
jgi:hypothetical protein